MTPLKKGSADQTGRKRIARGGEMRTLLSSNNPKQSNQESGCLRDHDLGPDSPRVPPPPRPPITYSISRAKPKEIGGKGFSSGPRPKG